MRSEPVEIWLYDPTIIDLKERGQKKQRFDSIKMAAKFLGVNCYTVIDKIGGVKLDGITKQTRIKQAVTGKEFIVRVAKDKITYAK